METSKEEAQSFNEELHSVNSQLRHKIGELDETSNDLANLLSGTEVATVFLDTELRIKWFSPATKQLLELVTSDTGRPISHFARKFADDRLLSDADTVLEKLIPVEAEIRSDEGKWFLRRILPYRTRDNRIAGLVIIFMDMTAQRRASEAINEARIYAEAIVETGRQSLVVLDAELRVQSANQAFYKLFELTPGKAVGRSLYDLGEGEWNIAELRKLIDEVLPKNQQVQDFEFAFGPTGVGGRCILLNARKLLRNGGRDELILLAIEDITERKHSAMHQDMLIGELNHRVKNVLATVQAIMTQTLRRSEFLNDFKETFVGRLHALAQAHNLLVEKEWVGADVGQIVNDTLAPYRTGHETCIMVDGPSLSVRPQVGVALMMILHELGTNALKYGSLSAPAGKLSVTWHKDGEGSAERFHVRWNESGGPKVTPPSRQGFGTKLIDRSATHELGGEARLEYREEGVRCEFERLVGLHILIVEDEVMVAMMLEEFLEDFGCRVALAGSVEEALAFARENTPDGVLLDMNVHGRKTIIIAEELASRSVPFLLVTGYGMSDGDPPVIKAAPRMQKPFNEENLGQQMAQVFGAARQSQGDSPRPA